jgi:putative hydrolase
VIGTAEALGLPDGLGRVDLHTHSTWTDGADDLAAMVAAAQAAGLAVLGCSDHVRADSDWVADYVAVVQDLAQQTARRSDGALSLRCGVETKILDTAGRLDLPALPAGVQYLVVSDHQFPGPRGPVPPRVVADSLERGQVGVGEVVEHLLGATAAAVRSAPLPVVVGHLFSILPKLGLTEADVSTALLADLADACRATGALVEVNEKWSCPSGAVLRQLQAAGVGLVTGSDAHAVDQVGRREHLEQVVRVLDVALLGEPAGVPARQP